ncbi:hypothetical protein BT93_F3187 [Corymbia citriodora subsp. variegata]|nr:hypothetical protein BT93_F3187 [Corymbia citriodora subsp. variegata]
MTAVAVAPKLSAFPCQSNDGAQSRTNPDRLHDLFTLSSAIQSPDSSLLDAQASLSPSTRKATPTAATLSKWQSHLAFLRTYSASAFRMACRCSGRKSSCLSRSCVTSNCGVRGSEVL